MNLCGEQDGLPSASSIIEDANYVLIMEYFY